MVAPSDVPSYAEAQSIQSEQDEAAAVRSLHERRAEFRHVTACVHRSRPRLCSISLR
jgi:hypothetical protein